MSWSGIFAGVVAALAVQLSLSLLGAAIGTATLGGDETPSAGGLAIGSAIWMGVSVAISAFVGGWTAARSARYLSPEHGRLNGVLTGCLLAVLSLVLTVSTLSGAVRSALGIASSATSAVASAAGSIVGGATAAVQNTGGLQNALDRLGLGDELQELMSGLNREEISTLIAQRDPKLSQQQVEAATTVVLGEMRNAARNIGSNLSNLSNLPDMIRRQADSVQTALSGETFRQRLQARGLSGAQAQEVSTVISQRVTQLRAESQSRAQAIRARADELRRDAAATASTTAWISLLMFGLMIGLSTLGGAVGSGLHRGEGMLREKVARGRATYQQTPVNP